MNDLFTYRYVLRANELVQVLNKNSMRIRYTLRFLNDPQGARLKFDLDPSTPGLPIRSGSDGGNSFDDLLFPYVGDVYVISPVDNEVFVLEYVKDDPSIPRSRYITLEQVTLWGSDSIIYYSRADPSRKKFLLYPAEYLKTVWYRIDGSWVEHKMFSPYNAIHTTYQNPNDSYYWSFSQDEFYTEWTPPGPWNSYSTYLVVWR